jgi:hypothetical protein
MDELFSLPLLLASSGVVSVLFASTLVYLEGLFGGEA